MFVKEIEFLGYTGESTYDIEVEHTHNFLVSEQDLVAHNSGVGRSYDDDMILVDWDHAPNLRVVLHHEHKDFNWSAHESVRDALHKYGPESRNVMWWKVEDSREGWAQALEVWENAAFEKIHKDKMLILDFSKVRHSGSPIKGMQNRPASGPVPLMNAFLKASTIKGSAIEPWKQNMIVDHVFAECVLVGGARRSARMSTKFWKDKSILDFIRIKRPIEFSDMTMDEVIQYRRDNPNTFGFLWSSNNSVTIDKEFWDLVDQKRSDPKYHTSIAKHARKVWRELTQCSYGDGTGEPGIINVDKLVQKNDGWAELTAGPYIASKKYQIREESELFLNRLARRAKKKIYTMITNPCVTGDTVIATLKGPKSFAELARTEEDVLVYAWHPQTKLPVIRWMRRPHKTQENVDVLEIEFDSGLKVKCTPDHNFYSFRGGKIRAQELTIGQSIRAWSLSKHSDGQLRVHGWLKGKTRHQWVHRMLWECHYGPLDEGLVIHHIDRNPENNVIENLEPLTVFEHNQTHYDERTKAGFGIRWDRLPEMNREERQRNIDTRNHKVVGIRRAQKEDVYNGCVDDAHSYIILDPNPRAGLMSGIVSANCGEIALSVLGGYCVIGDVVPFHCDSISEAIEAFRATTRALIRVNTMDALYTKEVQRTNRIGVSITGIHEFAWKFFKCGFKDLLDPDFETYDSGSYDVQTANGISSIWSEVTNPRVRAAAFWKTLEKFNQVVKEEAIWYSKKLGIAVPHTSITVKPSGCLDKQSRIKTNHGVLSLEDIFKMNGVELDFYDDLFGVWFEPTVAMKVYDMNNELQEITRLFINGKSDTLRVSFEDGKYVDVTPDHKFLTKERGWVSAKDLDGTEDIQAY